jgi:hypothetical protein
MRRKLWAMFHGNHERNHTVVSERRMTPNEIEYRFTEYVKAQGDYLSYGEAIEVPGCRCKPTNVLYWELSEADPTECPIHGHVTGDKRC